MILDRPVDPEPQHLEFPLQIDGRIDAAAENRIDRRLVVGNGRQERLSRATEAALSPGSTACGGAG